MRTNNIWVLAFFTKFLLMRLFFIFSIIFNSSWNYQLERKYSTITQFVFFAMLVLTIFALLARVHPTISTLPRSSTMTLISPKVAISFLEINLSYFLFYNNWIFILSTIRTFVIWIPIIYKPFKLPFFITIFTFKMINKVKSSYDNWILIFSAFVTHVLLIIFERFIFPFCPTI